MMLSCTRLLFLSPVLWVSIAMASDPAMQDMPGMSDMQMPATSNASGSSQPAASPPKGEQATPMPGMEMSDDMPMEMPGMSMSHVMNGMLGPYTAERESSGTSWQPDSTPHQGLHLNRGDWMLMAHGDAFLVYDHQGGPRGDTKTFSESMAMLMAQRPLGDGTLGLRGMVSLDAAMGADGYPLLFATGETANGRTPLIDRQHPHDFLMELAASYSLPLGNGRAAYLYAGLPGEPALGPPTFMHRFSGMSDPEAPITHHWLDSTHITWGVVTAGFSGTTWKIEGSSFKGREPDQHRWDVESPKFDSAAVRGFWNPTPDWSLQASYGHLHSPEELSPEINEERVTTSATYNRRFGANDWATTFAWGHRHDHPGDTLDGFLLESTVVLHDTHTFFSRVERVDEDELFDGADEESSPLHGRIFTVNQFTLGYIYDLRATEHWSLGLGGLVTRYAYPDALDSTYGSDPTSLMLFVRLRLL